MLAAVVACPAGISGFLVIARPSGGRSYVSLTAALPLAAGLAVVLAGCLAAARLSPQARALALALALACGIDYGAAAFCVKLLTADFSGARPRCSATGRSTAWLSPARWASCSTRTPTSGAS
jgi:hypothetical protein